MELTSVNFGLPLSFGHKHFNILWVKVPIVIGTIFNHALSIQISAMCRSFFSTKVEGSAILLPIGGKVSYEKYRERKYRHCNRAKTQDRNTRMGDSRVD